MAAAKYSRYYTQIKPVIENRIVRSVAPYIFSLITMTILIIFAIRPTISTIANLQKDIENQQQILNALNEKEISLTQGRGNLQNISMEKRSKIGAAIPDNPDVPLLISSLRGASQTQASVSALQVQPVALLNPAATQQQALLKLGEINFSYNVQGAYGQLIGTLYNLQRSSRVISIENLSLSKQAEDVTVLSITGKAYFLK